MQPTPLFLPGKCHRQRSLEDYSPWDCKESNMTEHTHTHTRIDNEDHGWKVKQERGEQVKLGERHILWGGVREVLTGRRWLWDEIQRKRGVTSSDSWEEAHSQLRGLQMHRLWGWRRQCDRPLCPGAVPESVLVDGGGKNTWRMGLSWKALDECNSNEPQPKWPVCEGWKPNAIDSVVKRYWTWLLLLWCLG